MKGRVVVLGRIGGREAAALVVDGRLDDLLVAPPENAPPAPGTILRGVADRPVKGLGGMFLRLPDGARGFLKDTDGIAPGQGLIVQVAGVAEPGKAVPVTRRLVVKGRYAIVTPGATGLNVSRQVREPAERVRLQALLDGAGEPDGAAHADEGAILRSAAAGADAADILAELAELRSVARRIAADTAGAPECLLDAPGPHEAAWRDWADPPPDGVEEGADAFARTGADDLVAELLNPVAGLPGGGFMAIEPTRALVAVDVNTGPDTSPAAGLKANIAAARDLPRQLRLRGLGGQVVVGFAPMPKRDRAALDQQIRAAFRADAGEATLAGWTALGNFELQRRRDRMPLATALHVGEVRR
jgi:Ribonuclease G/E